MNADKKSKLLMTVKLALIVFVGLGITGCGDTSESDNASPDGAVVVPAGEASNGVADGMTDAASALVESATDQVSVVTEKAKETITKVSKEAKEAIQSFLTQTTSQLSAQEKILPKLKDMARTTADDKLSQIVAAIEGKISAVREKLAAIKSSDGGTYETLKLQAGTLMSELKTLYDQALARVTELKKSFDPTKLPGLGGIKLPG